MTFDHPVNTRTAFPSIRAWVDAAIERTIKLPEHAYIDKDLNKQIDFYGAPHDVIQSYGRDGWVEGAQMIREQFATAIALRTVSLIPTLGLSDEPDGSGVDVASFLSGDDDYWHVQSAGERLIDVPGNAVHFDINIAMASRVDTGRAQIRALGIAAAIYLLDRAGVRVSADVCSKTTEAGQPIHLSAPLKKMGEPIDLPMLAFWCGHPGVVRYFHLHATAGFCRTIQPLSRSTNELRPGYVSVGPLLEANSHDTQTMVAWVKNVLNANGILLREP